MSASRSVAAAQRRRAGPPEPQQQVRGPNTSINSSQVFSPNQQQQQQQIRPGTSGRLAGQQAALQQQQFQQAQGQGQTQKQGQGQPGSKMSVAQAITLITLRLGRVEQQLQHYDPSSNTLSNENVDSSLIDSILQRLYTLEQQDPNIYNDNQDLSNIKKQIETIKGNFIEIRNTFAINSKVFDGYKMEI